MNLLLVGLNHTTAPVGARERLAFPEARLGAALQRLASESEVAEAIILSTCNRVEVIVVPNAPTAQAVEAVTNFLCEVHDLPSGQVRPHLYVHQSSAAVRHVLRVASSLDSMIVGESQILGQVKRAYAVATAAGTVGRHLHRLFERAFAVAKRVRSETGIGAYAISLGSVSVELARKIFDHLHDKALLLIGAGEMAELSAKCFFEAGIESLLVANRTLAHAQRIADCFHGGGRAIGLDELPARLHEADIVVASTGATTCHINRSMAQAALERRRYRPLLLFDLSVPRTIAPDIGLLDNAFVFDLDDLQRVIAANQRERRREAERAEAIVEAETVAFLAAFDRPDIGPTIAALKERLTDICAAEFERHRKRLGALTPEQEAAIRDFLLEGIVNKTLHPLILGLREAAQQGSEQIDLRRVFALDALPPKTLTADAQEAPAAARRRG
ncbi:MAG: glutamyl-tRNA reductase [Chloracidobacterium sp. CP2_5A]|nr:MAG: glutamyl-tRNA reductase [Chloracidobacterium sp. CP2_5A]